jgi:cyclophilin family peptidyl-prolyl cis-trans isomerase
VYCGEEVDAFAAYCADLDRCYFLSFSACRRAGRSSYDSGDRATINGPACAGELVRVRRYTGTTARGHSSAGRALAWHARGRRFEPGWLHFPVKTATLHTNHGEIALELFDEDAPKTVDNFVKLSQDGFYDGITFHRVIPDFMIQGGCPRGDGTGGPGYEFEDEPNHHRIVRGALAMANRGPDTNGSQFFIVTTEAAPWLDGKHTVFGRVRDGMDVVDEIAEVPRDAGDRPRDPVTIDRVKLS